MLALASACLAPGWAFVPVIGSAGIHALPGPRSLARAGGPRYQRAPRLSMQLQEERSEAATPPARHSLAPIAAVCMTLLMPAVAAAEPPEWLEDTRSSLDIGLALFSLLFFLRIPLTWYPQVITAKTPSPFPILAYSPAFRTRAGVSHVGVSLTREPCRWTSRRCRRRS